MGIPKLEPTEKVQRGTMDIYWMIGRCWRRIKVSPRRKDAGDVGLGGGDTVEDDVVADEDDVQYVFSGRWNCLDLSVDRSEDQ
jgi:hypothetical protein